MVKTIKDLLENGYDLMVEGKLTDAIEYFNKVLQKDPTIIKALNNKAIALIGLENYSEALSCVNKSIKINKSFSDSYFIKGEILILIEKYEKAYNCIKKGLKFYSEDVYALNLMGITLNRMGKYNEALDYFEKALKLDPNYPNALVNKANELINLYQSEEALKVLNIIHTMEIDDMAILMDLGSLFEYLEEENKAVSSYKKALKLKPHDPEILFSVGNAYHINHPREALKWYEKTLKIDSKHKDALIYRSNAMDIIGKHKYALKSIEKALKIYPNNKHALLIKGIILYNLKRFNEGLESLKMALNENQNYTNGRIIYWIYRTLKRLGKKEDAEKYKKMLEKCDEILIESSLENRIINNLEIFKRKGYDLKFIKNQYKCKDRNAYIDILCEDKKTGNYVIIELKTLMADKNTYYQIYNYVHSIKNTIAGKRSVEGLVISKWFDKSFEKLARQNDEISYIKLKDLGFQ